MGDESESRRLKHELDEINRQRFLEMSLPRVRSVASPTAWACFEQRLIHDRPASSIAADLGISVNAVFVYASRVLKMVRHQCTALATELGEEDGDFLPGGA